VARRVGAGRNESGQRRSADRPTSRRCGRASIIGLGPAGRKGVIDEIIAIARQSNRSVETRDWRIGLFDTASRSSHPVQTGKVKERMPTDRGRLCTRGVLQFEPDGATLVRCVLCLSTGSDASHRGRNFAREWAGWVAVVGAAQTGRTNGDLTRPGGSCGGASGVVSRILRSPKRSFPGAQNLLRLTLC
jgi:hypothetical protein